MVDMGVVLFWMLGMSNVLDSGGTVVLYEDSFKVCQYLSFLNRWIIIVAFVMPHTHAQKMR